MNDEEVMQPVPVDNIWPDHIAADYSDVAVPVTSGVEADSNVSAPAYRRDVTTTFLAANSIERLRAAVNDSWRTQSGVRLRRLDGCRLVEVLDEDTATITALRAEVSRLQEALKLAWEEMNVGQRIHWSSRVNLPLVANWDEVSGATPDHPASAPKSVVDETLTAQPPSTEGVT